MRMEEMIVRELAENIDGKDLIFSVCKDGVREYYEFQEFINLSKGAEHVRVRLHWISEACIVTNIKKNDGMAIVLMHKRMLINYPVEKPESIRQYAQECAQRDETAIADCCTSTVELCEAAQDMHIEPDFKMSMPSRFHTWTDNHKIYIKLFTDAYVERYQKLSRQRIDKLIGDM